MTRLQTRLRDERGMTLIMVATGMVAFLSATMLAVDVGMLMVARTESQSAADAGALAGAVALAFDDFDDRYGHRPGRPQRDCGRHRGRNSVMNAAGVGHRGGRHVSDNQSGARARAAQRRARQPAVDVHRADVRHPHRRHRRRWRPPKSSPANAMTCVKPFTVPDKWIERQTPPWDPDDTFDVVDNKGKPLADPDIYIPLGQTGYTGYNAVTDRGAAHHPEGRARARTSRRAFTFRTPSAA